MLYNPLDGDEGVKADSEKASIWIYHRFSIYMNEHSMYANFMERHGIGILVIGLFSLFHPLISNRLLLLLWIAAFLSSQFYVFIGKFFLLPVLT